MSSSWEQVQGLLHCQAVRSCGGREFSAHESAYRLACSRKRNGKNQVEKWFPSVKGCPVADSGKVKR